VRLVLGTRSATVSEKVAQKLAVAALFLLENATIAPDVDEGHGGWKMDRNM
jgi:hypothetical protein